MLNKKVEQDQFFNKDRRKLLGLAGIAGAGALLAPLLAKAAPTTVIEAGSNVDTASYIIFKDGSTVYAKNGNTGKIDFQGTDASTVINNAMNNLTAGRTWKEKVVVKGDYIISHEILVPSYTVLDLTGAKIKIANGADNSGVENVNLIINKNWKSGSDSNITIIGGYLDGNGANLGGGFRGGLFSVVIGFKNTTDIVVKNTYVVNAKWEGIILSNGTQRSVIEGNTATNCGYQGICAEFTAKDYIIANNICFNNQHSGILAAWNQDGSGFTSPNNGIVSGNHCYGNQWGIAVDGSSISKPHNILILNNDCHDNTQRGILVVAGEYITIKGNNVYNNIGDGITLWAWGIVNQSNDVNNIIIDGNICYNNLSGIVCYHGSDYKVYNINVNNNLCYLNKNHGIYFKYVANFVASGNQCANNSKQTGGIWSGITLENSKYGLIQNNRCYDDQSAKTQAYGTGEGSGCDNNIFMNNDVRSNVAGGIITVGANTVVKNNVGYLTENKGAASVSNGGTVSHGLAKAPVSVRVTPSVAGEIVSVTSISPTNFTVAIKKPDGSAGTPQTIYWEAEA